MKVKKLKKGEEGLQQALETLQKKIENKNENSTLAELNYKFYKEMIEEMGNINNGEFISRTESGMDPSGDLRVKITSSYKEDGFFVKKIDHREYDLSKKKMEKRGDEYYIIRDRDGQYEIFEVSFDPSKKNMVSITFGIGTDAEQNRTFNYVEDVKVKDLFLFVDASEYVVKINEMEKQIDKANEENAEIDKTNEEDAESEGERE